MESVASDLLHDALKRAEAELPRILQAQITDPGHPDFGAVDHGDTGLTYLPTRIIEIGIPLYVYPESQYCGDEELGRRIRMAGEAFLRMQDPDGTISMLDCNFHSPPDTGFVIARLAPALEVARRFDRPSVSRVVEPVEEFLRRTGPAMLSGGIHTPNHRWVLVGALSWLYHLFGGQEFVARADEWLAEGLDITEDGEWTERSSGEYNLVCAAAMFAAARLLNRPHLLEPVRRNLRRMIYFTHPNGELVTEISHRQDRGRSVTVSRYYPYYRFLAAIDKDGEFAAMADWARELGGSCSLLEEILYSDLSAADVPRAPLPTTYTKTFGRNDSYPDLPRIFHYDRPRHRYTPLAPVVRARRGDLSLTLMGENPHFLSMRAGKAELVGVRVVPAYFGCGPIRFPAIVEQGGRFILEREWTAWYNGPLPPEARVESGVWSAMDHSRRPLDHHGRLLIRCEVTIHDDGFDLLLECTGRERVPVQLALLFNPSGSFDDLTGLQQTSDGSFILLSGDVRYRQGGDCIKVSGAGSSHRMESIRGDEPRRGTLNLLLNTVTPARELYRIRRSEG